ncbi:beta-1,3-galactosyltransferase 4 [Bufo gargarizans]|uniref:beta-1,3-galactosyltransferase 4 n=1 Tax=Bufo gargarizans TaxID=30331 RepID=UPI001CF4626E|nr:beta-1,3-galactosyltransferase 4 [Bufo gargarizans]
MLPCTATRLRPLLLLRRRWPLIFLLASLMFFLSVMGYLEEFLSGILSIFYSMPSPVSSPRVLNVPIPPFLLSPARACSLPPFLLILVSSAPSHRDRRDAIRQTWGNLASSTASSSLTLFVLAVPKSPEERAALMHEAVTHRDIIQANFSDSYRNLTLKTITGLTWALEKCRGARFLLKTDDDVFVNTVHLSQFLQSESGLHYMGRLHWHVSPYRDPENRHYVSQEMYGGNYFPPYCSGTGYVLSSEAAALILGQLPSGPWPAVEDVYVGILAKAAGIAPRHVVKIAGSMSVPHTPCCYRIMFTSHGLMPEGMQEAWEMLKAAENRWCPSLSMLFCKVFGQMLEKGSEGVH